MKKVLGEARPVFVVLKTCIIIFVLKLLEFLFYKEIASGYPDIVECIMDSDCIRASAFSLLIFIIIYVYLRNKMIDNYKVLIIVLIFTISLIYLVVIAFSYSYPTNLRICRSVGLLLSIITCVFISYKE